MSNTSVALDLEQRLSNIRESSDRLAAAPWDDIERDTVLRALARPQYESVVDACENLIVLPARDNAEGGRYRTSRTPYVREVLESFADTECEEIVLCWSTQVGKTTTELATVAYAIKEQPGPGLFVWPTEDLAKEANEERVLPMLKESAILRAEFTGRSADLASTRLRMRQMDIHFAWATSAARLASKAKRYIWYDEIDKFPAFTGKEADPISLGIERARTFWNRKIILSSTPTLQDGNIWRRYQNSDMRRYEVPCPHCGHKQALNFQRVKWPADIRDAEKVRIGRLAWYECEACNERIEDHHKPRMLADGAWAIGNPDVKLRRGYHLNALYSPWLTFSEVAATFLDAHGDREKLMNFVNSWLAEPWVEGMVKLEDERVKRLQGRYSINVIPARAVMITAGVDVQTYGCYYSIHAWAVHPQEQWLLEFGLVKHGEGDGNSDMRELAEEALSQSRVWEQADNLSGVTLRRVCMDSRFRRDEVLQFCREHSELITPIMGSQAAMTAPFSWFAVDAARTRKKRRKAYTGLQYARIDTTYYKDWIARLYAGQHEDSGEPLWHFPEEVDDEYIRQFLSEHKETIRRPRGVGTVNVWRPRPGSVGRNHYWDCAVYALAAADIAGLGTMPPHGTIEPDDEIMTVAQWRAQSRR